jgi:hypothetical protein
MIPDEGFVRFYTTETFTITQIASDNGIILPSNDQTIHYGARSSMIYFRASPGYQIDYVKIDGALIQKGSQIGVGWQKLGIFEASPYIADPLNWDRGTFQFYNVKNNHTIEVAFTTATIFNRLYFSDGYGLKTIDIEDLVGESQDIISTALSETTIPKIPSNKIIFISGNEISGNNYLSLSYDGYGPGDAYGASIIKNEIQVTNYLDGYDGYCHTACAHITDKGVLYLINRTLNRIEAYYGAHKRNGKRYADYIYNSSSTPSILPGEILTLHVVSNASLRMSGGARLYVGTTTGVTRIETYDKQTVDGYSDHLDTNGISITYGISGSYTQYPVLGGTISRVTKISSDDEKSIFFVVANDGSGNGGITQVSLSGNRRLIYMTKETGFLPSNDVRDIFGKGS